jgi:hypothetical protein
MESFTKNDTIHGWMDELDGWMTGRMDDGTDSGKASFHP